MSINVYLRGEEVRDLEGFTTTPRRNRDQEWNEYSLPGVKLWLDNGRWHVTLYDVCDRIPAAVAGIVEEVSYREFLILPPREAGVYLYESARAEVGPSTSGDKSSTRVSIQAQTLEDLRELLLRIKTGSIRPELSYEAEQGGQSHAELTAEIERLRGIEQARSHTADRLETVRTGLGELHVELEKGWCWPRRFKEMAMKEILRLIRL